MTLDDVHHLVSHYGYWLMAFGAIIEGETFLIAGGIAVAHGWLKLPWTLLLAVVGSTVHDCLLFFLGRHAGEWLLKRKPQWAAKSEGVLRVFDRFGVGLILLMRFAYGLRTIIPTIIGLSHISTRKFFVFDVIGGIIWSSFFIIGAMYLGAMIFEYVPHLGYYLKDAWDWLWSEV